MYLNIALAFVIFVVTALLVREGMWSNAIRLFNVVTAALLATNYFEPLADLLTSKAPSFTYCWDILSLWGLFAAILAAMQFVTDKVSHIQVRFRKPVEAVGGPFFAVWIAWVMVCFTTFSLHVAPMSRTFLADAFEPAPDAKMFFGFAPDQQWLAFMHTMSLDGAWGKSRKSGDTQTDVFDPNADFIFKYAASRQRYEQLTDIRTRGTR